MLKSIRVIALLIKLLRMRNSSVIRVITLSEELESCMHIKCYNTLNNKKLKNIIIGREKV